MGHVFGTLGPLVAAVRRGGSIRVRETVVSWMASGDVNRIVHTAPGFPVLGYGFTHNTAIEGREET